MSIGFLGSSFLHISHTGNSDVDIDVGGIGYFLGEMLKGLGEDVKFASLLNNSIYSRIIIENLKQKGFNVIVEKNKELPLSALIDFEGKKALSLPLLNNSFSDAFLQNEFYPNCSKIVVDGYINKNTLLDVLSQDVKKYAVGISADNFKHYMQPNKWELIASKISDFEHLRKYAKKTATTERGLMEWLGCDMVVFGEKKIIILEATSGVKTVLPFLSNYGEEEMGVLLGYVIKHHKELPLRELLNDFDVNSYIKKSEHSVVEQFIFNIDTLAHKDNLTQLYNRNMANKNLLEKKSRFESNGIPWSILLFDVDHFKSFNDTYGHNIGDKVLKDVADVIRLSVRDRDIPCRWGGEEFLCILPNITKDEAFLTAERIRSNIENELKEPRQITVSIGIAEYDGSVDLINLIDRADQALYKAKKAGRNNTQIF